MACLQGRGKGQCLKDLGLVPMTPQRGHCARAASQALPKELLGKGLGVARGPWLCCVTRPSPGGKKGSHPFLGDWPADAPCQRLLGTATISEISFGICSRRISSETARELHVFHFIDQEFPAKIALVRSPGARNLWIAGKRQRSREPQTDPRGAFLCLQALGPEEPVCQD
jgi:hypothetical protein